MEGLTDTVGTWFQNLFSGAQSYGGALINSVAEIPADWNAKVAELKSKGAEFMALFNQLQAMKSVADNSDPQLQAEYNSVMSRGATIRSTIQNVTSGIDQVYGKLSSLFGASMSMGALGAVQLIPIAVIAGAVALVVYWIADAVSLRTKLQAAAAAHANAQQVTDIVTGRSSALGLPAGFFGSAGTLLLVGGAVLVLAPLLRRALNR